MTHQRFSTTIYLKKNIKNRECFLLLDPQTWTQNLALAYHALAEKVRSDYNKNKKQKTTPQTYIIPLCLQIKFFSKSYPKQTRYERLELFMNRCPPRPLKEIALSNVHEKQGLKIKYFSAVLKNFWRLKVFSSELFFFSANNQLQRAFITQIFILYSLYKKRP